MLLTAPLPGLDADATEGLKADFRNVNPRCCAKDGRRRAATHRGAGHKPDQPDPQGARHRSSLGLKSNSLDSRQASPAATRMAANVAWQPMRCTGVALLLNDVFATSCDQRHCTTSWDAQCMASDVRE